MLLDEARLDQGCHIVVDTPVIPPHATSECPDGGETLERAAAIANHPSTRTAQLHDRRSDDVKLDDIERILI